MLGGDILVPHGAIQYPNSPSPRVVSCRFFCLDCGDDSRSVFQKEYSSSLEQGGVKVLRCFPHCCSSHDITSFTRGPPLHLLVTFSDDATALRQSHQLVVCCRFESVTKDVSVGSQSDPNALSLTVGDTVVLPTAESLGSLSTGNWVIGKQESDDNQRDFPQNAVVYVFNDQQSEWVVDDSKSAKYRLVAYVLKPRAPSFAKHFEGERLIYQTPTRLSTVICRQSSPALSVLPHVEQEALDEQRSFILKTTALSKTTGKLGASFKETVTVGSACLLSPATGDEEQQGPHGAAWQLNRHISEVAFSDKMLHLAIPLFFLAFTPFSAVGHILGRRDERQCASASAARRTLWVTVQHQAAVASRACNSSTEWFLPEDDGIVRETTHLLLNVLTASSTCQLIRSTFTTTDTSAASSASVQIPTKTQFQERFYEFVEKLYDAVVVVLRNQGPDDSRLRLSDLATGLLTVIHERPSFRPLRKAISKMPLDRSLVPVTHALQSFIAQLREVYVAHWKKSADQESRIHTLPLGMRKKADHFCCWNGRWVIDAETTRVAPYDAVVSGGVLIWMLCIQQLATIDIQVSSASESVGEHGNTVCNLSISTVPLDSTDTSSTSLPDGMRLVLDGRFRVFRTLPNGVASLAASLASQWDIGDYIGSFVSDTRDEIELQFFAIGHDFARDDSDPVADAERLKPRTSSNSLSVYRLELTLSNGEKRPSSNPVRQNPRKPLTIEVQGNISVAALSTDRTTLADMSSAARGAKLATLYWVTTMALRYRYTCTPAEIEYIVSL